MESNKKKENEVDLNNFALNVDKIYSPLMWEIVKKNIS